MSTQLSFFVDETEWPEPQARQLYEGLLERWEAREFKPYFGDMLTAVVGSILSQRTNYKNQRRAHDALWEKFGSWEAIAQGDVEEIEQAIAASTYPEAKAPAIQGFLRALYRERGDFDLSFLRELSAQEGFAWLTSFKGIGHKTASFALLFHLGKPVLPVDTHVGRVSKRYGLIPERASASKAHDLLNAMMPPQDALTMYNFHRVLFYHGQRICTFNHPRCHECPVSAQCDSFNRS